MIYGIAVFPYYTGVTSSVYTVTATDSAGLTASTQLSVTVNTVNLLRVSHELSMRIATDYQFFVSDIRHALWWAGNVTRVLAVTTEQITLLGVREGSVIVQWSNNSINSINPPYTCPARVIFQYYDSVRASVTVALPQYQINSISLHLVGICRDYTTTTTSTTSSTTPTTTQITTTPTTTTASTTTSGYLLHIA